MKYFSKTSVILLLTLITFVAGVSAQARPGHDSTTKALRVTMTTTTMVMYGDIAPVKLTTSPAVTGTCSLYYNASGFRNDMGTLTLKVGKASGKVRWLYADPTVAWRFALSVDCKGNGYAGSTGVYVAAYPK
jgi:hypothetical protein